MVFDIHRDENSTLRLAEFVKEKEAEIILFTDQWQSPVAVLASRSFSNRIVVPSAWDSLVTCMLVQKSLLLMCRNAFGGQPGSVWKSLKTCLIGRNSSESSEYIFEFAYPRYLFPLWFRQRCSRRSRWQSMPHFMNG